MAGDTVLICATGTYTLTATVTWNVTGLVITVSGANATGTVDGTKATITSATNSVALFTFSGTISMLLNYLTFTHTAVTRGDGLFTANAGSTVACEVNNCVFDGCAIGIHGDFASFDTITNLIVNDTEIKNCTSHGIWNTAGGIIRRSWIHNNTGDGWRYANHGSSPRGQSQAIGSVIAGNANGINLGADITVATLNVVNCDIVSNTSNGILSAVTAASQLKMILENNIIQSNGANGVNMAAAPVFLVNRNNAYRNNTSGNFNNFSAGTNDVTLTGDPFTNAAGGDYSLNSTAGAGAACKAAAFPGVSLFGTGYLDIGALQSQGSGGAGGAVPIQWIVTASPGP